MKADVDVECNGYNKYTVLTAPKYANTKEWKSCLLKGNVYRRKKQTLNPKLQRCNFKETVKSTSSSMSVTKKV